jgi:uncharacterized membrane protein
MLRTIYRITLLLACWGLALSAVAQERDTSQGPTAPNASPQIQNPGNLDGHKPPDMVCFGYGPKWSIQFVDGAARYLGVNQPDQVLLGEFYYDPSQKIWEWHRANGLAPMNGSFDLSATVQKESCQDPVRKQTFPYSAQVNLPQGDMVSGCCRKLKPGEAAIGKHGMQPTAPAPNVPAPTGSATSPSGSGTASPNNNPVPQ